MCGICGIINYKNKNEIKIIKEMMDTLDHRGPDESGYKIFDDKKAAFE